MAAVILFLVPLFHGLVFTGLAYWFKKSQKPREDVSTRLALVVAIAGALANIVLCVTLIELLSGLSFIASQQEVSLTQQFPVMLGTQPVFMLVVFFIAKQVFAAKA